MFSRNTVTASRLSRLIGKHALVCLLALPLCAVASEVTISARYKGDAAGRFENTTPEASFCAIWPGHCQRFDTFTASLPIAYEKTSTHGAQEPREQFFIKLPARRTVQVTRDQGGDTHELDFEITYVSQRLRNDPNFTHYENPVFTTSVRGGCFYAQTFGHSREVAYLWGVRVPENPSGCYSSGGSGDQGATHVNRVSQMGVGYKLVMPSPLRMKQGTYRGSADFTVGPGGDFDFGDRVRDLNSPTLRINFELEVQHAFVVSFPPDSDRAVLVPPGGWQRWLGGGAPPSRLERSMPLRLWSTGPFSVHKACQYSLGANCAIRDDAGHQVPVEVALTLPAGVHYANARVHRLGIPTGRADALTFDTAMPVGGQSGQLHFDVLGAGVRSMLDHPGSTYRGEVTVVFDAMI